MITVGFNPRKVADLRAALSATGKGLSRELAVAVNATAKKGKSEVSKQIRQELNATKKAVDTTISIHGKATAQSTSSTVSLKKTKRLPLKEFKARQNASGVVAKISKRGSQTFVASGFMGPQPGNKAAKLFGHAFKRRGKSRLPIVKLMGVSPWGAFVKRNMTPPTTKQIGAELEKQINKRIRFLLLKSQNKLNWQQKGR